MAKKVDLIGMRYGKLTVVERTDQREHGYCLWRCRCDCGGEILVSTKRQKNGTVTDDCETASGKYISSVSIGNSQSKAERDFDNISGF